MNLVTRKVNIAKSGSLPGWQNKSVYIVIKVLIYNIKHFTRSVYHTLRLLLFFCRCHKITGKCICKSGFTGIHCNQQISKCYAYVPPRLNMIE